MVRLIIPTFIPQSGNTTLDTKRQGVLLDALGKEIDISRAGRILVGYGGDVSEYHGVVGLVADHLSAESRMIPGWEKRGVEETFDEIVVRVYSGAESLDREDLQVVVAIVSPQVERVLYEWVGGDLDTELYPGEALVFTEADGGRSYFI